MTISRFYFFSVFTFIINNFYICSIIIVIYINSVYLTSKINTYVIFYRYFNRWKSTVFTKLNFKIKRLKQTCFYLCSCCNYIVSCNFLTLFNDSKAVKLVVKLSLSSSCFVYSSVYFSTNFETKFLYCV